MLKMYFSEKFLKCIELTKKMLIDKCHTERREARRKSMEDKLRLGDWNHRSYNVSFQDRKLDIMIIKLLFRTEKPNGSVVLLL